ncbi:hypothetical protein CBR_g28888 [Chara braunii]|uniref:CCHC-type domain-containing protein n=1 Tax=Chara braunii TaxID=69332 RepID=A0A388LAG1_CHABU|nr:hypothetical protein CBR_g28888 [Chara braunii]|eukprot:GBG79172.1 hypothetical protein CBR_g28888 [Chara braunii]
MADNRSCYNCGQRGHTSCFCPHPDRRLQGGQSNSLAIVPAQPIPTFPPIINSQTNVGTAAPAYQSYSNGGGWLGKRVSSLEEIVAEIKVKHDTDKAREQATREEEENKKRLSEEEEKRARDKTERGEFQAQMNREVGLKLDKVYEAVNVKKNESNDELTKQKARIEELQQKHCVASTSTGVPKATVGGEEVIRLRREQIELREALNKRFAALEEVIRALQRQCEDAEANAEVWKAEALRLGNKRGGVVIGVSPVPHSRVRSRVTPAMTPNSTLKVDERLKGVVDRHQMEVNVLQDMRLKEVNARKQMEKEVEKMKEEMAKMQMQNRVMTQSNLKARLDEAAVQLTRKAGTGKEKVVPSLTVKEKATPAPLDSREVFLRKESKALRGMKKEEIMTICSKEDITYTTLEPTKEEIAQKRTTLIFDTDEGNVDKGKEVSVFDVTEDGENDSENDGRESAAS